MTRRLHLLSGLLARFTAGTARRRARRRQSAAVAAALSELNEYYLRDIGFWRDRPARRHHLDHF